MPLYEFQCEACEARFERIQKYSDPIPEICPACGKGPVRKLPSSPAIQFKGSGFYITDYPKQSSSEAGSGAAKSSGDKSGGDGGGSTSSSSSGESKSAESKSTETKPSETKSTASKPTDTKS